MLKPTDMLDTKGTVVKNIRHHDNGSYTATVYRGSQKYLVTFDTDGNFISTVA